MNVLLITYSFPPAAGVGVLRALSFAKYLPESDINLHVLTARNAAAVGHDASALAGLPPSVHIHRTWTPDLPFALRKSLKKLVSRPAKGASAPNAGPPQPGRPNPLKQLVGNLLLPDPQVGWLPFALRAARSIIRRSHIDAVVVTVPPFSSVRLVTKLRRLFPSLPIVLDFRDEWLTTTIDLVSFNNNQRARDVAHKAESEAVRDASAVVCVTHAAVAELRKRYPSIPQSRFHCIPNGFDRDPAPPTPLPPSPADPIVLTYIGTVYGSTDPLPVVRAILALPPRIRTRLHLRFVGHIETPALRATLQTLNHHIHQLDLVGFLPQAQALANIASTTYLLLITHDPINVAAKLYDYLASGRPILAAVHPTGDVRRILETTRAGWGADITSPQALAELFTNAVVKAPQLCNSFSPDTAAIAAYHRRPLAAAYASLLNSLVTPA